MVTPAAGWQDIGAVEALPSGQYLEALLDEADVAVFNVGGQLHAIENVCTHDGGRLSGGRLEGRQIICPRHGARFDVTTGSACTPPAYEDVHVFPVRVQDGRIQVRDDRWD